MSFLDSFKIAMHNLWQNKSRTVLTVIIVLVVSALIMAMCLIGTNFISNNDRMLKETLDREGTYYSLDSRWGNYESYSATLDEAVSVMDTARQYPDAVTYSGVLLSSYASGNEVAVSVTCPTGTDRYGSSLSNLLYADFFFPMSTVLCGDMLEGRTWNVGDNEQNGIWLSSDAMKNASAVGYDLSVGDTLTLSFNVLEYKDGSGQQSKKTFAIEYALTGVFEAAESDNYYVRTPDYVVSIYPVLENLDGFTVAVDDIDMGFYKSKADYNYRDAEKSMKAFVKAANALVTPNYDDDGEEIDRFSNAFLDESAMMRVMGVLILGVLIVLAFLILLLSIGSVANTIIISVDKNRKFIGLMKAMGLKNKGVKQIVYKEAVVTILFGVLLATCLILAMSGVMGNLIASVLGSMYGSDFKLTFVIHPLVPIITALAFFGMAILFSKGSLDRMGKADVITIISEVA